MTQDNHKLVFMDSLVKINCPLKAFPSVLNIKNTKKNYSHITTSRNTQIQLRETTWNYV